MNRDLNLYNELKAAAEEIAEVEDHGSFFRGGTTIDIDCISHFKSGSIVVVDTDKLSNYGAGLLDWLLQMEEQ